MAGEKDHRARPRLIARVGFRVREQCHSEAMTSRRHLSKSRYIAGLQCFKKLWWTVNEPDAPELAPEGRQQTILDRGDRVGELARTHVPGGVLIDLPHYEVKERAAATANAL